MTPRRRRIYLMRHGAVDYFSPDGKPLPQDEVSLNAMGRSQAQAAGELFAHHRCSFDRVITSGLNRTVETASLILAQLAVALPIEVLSDLREIQPGRLRDLPRAVLEESFAAVTRGNAGLDTRFMGGESVGEMMGRLIPAINALRSDSSWQTLLLVLHGGVNRGVLSYLLTGETYFLGGFEQSPACINVIDVGNERRDVVVRATNLSPTDFLQHRERATTMERLFEQYLNIPTMTA